MNRIITVVLAALWMGAGAGRGQETDLSNLATLSGGKTVAQNALWGENGKDKQFTSSRRIVVADIQGPAVITMIHFALPEMSVAKPKEYTLGRDLLIRMYWDGETTPSVDCPLVDFFCDPAGLREMVNTAVVNKRRGFNAYFPMPFRKSGRIELVYDGPVEPGQQLWRMMPCYSYVMYRSLASVPEKAGYFHASWRQELLPLGQRDYVAMETEGSGKFVGWNVTVRLPGRPGYPVDENEKFYVDGEAEPSVEFQGLEDSFGFSWGFPGGENLFPLTGYFPFKDGAAAYRFFVQDAINFEKSLKVAIGFGKNEDPSFARQFSRKGSELEFSSVCYWYQTEPHGQRPAMPAAKDRQPRQFSWKDEEKLPTAQDIQARGVRLHVRCGRPEKETIYADSGYSAELKQGFSYAGFPFPVFHCWAHEQAVDVEMTVPKGSEGTVRLYVIDPDQFMGGRMETITVAGRPAGTLENFSEGKWVEQQVKREQTAGGKIIVRVSNARPESNAVVSIIEWVEKK